MANRENQKVLADATETRPQSNGSAARTRYGKVRLRTLSDIDARTAAYRRFKELVASYTSDLGGNPTTGQQAIIQRAVSLQVWCEDAEAAYAATGEMGIAQFTTATNALRRLLSDIGLERRARDVTPSVADYVRHLRETAAG
jgi:hypothetical protein